MLLYTMLYIVLAYLMLFAALTNSVCLNNASFFFLFKYFLCQGYELSGEIALKNNHYYYYYYYALSVFHILCFAYVFECFVFFREKCLKRSFIAIAILTITIILTITTITIIK